MSRIVQGLNLLGILALAALCGVQWHADHRLQMQLLGQEKSRIELADKLAEAERTIKGDVADLEDFRGRLTAADAALKDLQGKVKGDRTESDKVATERDQLKASAGAMKSTLDKWMAAVAERDQALKQLDAQVAKLAADRNDAVVKYNDLAAKYNAAEEELKKAGEIVQKLAAERNEAVAKFNELATKYNALAKEANGSTTRP